MYRPHIPLQKWFVAICLVANDKLGVSVWSPARELKVKWESAYYLLQLVRGMMTESGCLQRALGDAGMDDAYIGSGGGLRERGTDKAPFIMAAERARGGKLAIRAVLDCSGESYGEFAKWHIADSAHIRMDGWGGAKGGLRKWRGHEPKVFDKDDEDARLPLTQHVRPCASCSTWGRRRSGSSGRRR